jgi:hypothetical protein
VGAAVSVEWSDPSGVMLLAARVGEAKTRWVELELVGEPESVERRIDARAAVEVDVSAWTPAQPTRRLNGKTVDLSTTGALVSLPDLSPLAATVELKIALPGEPFHASARVAWRREPALAGVEFQRLEAAEQARLVDYLAGARPQPS